MILPFNTFTIHNLLGFTVTGSLAVMFYIVYLKAGRRRMDLLSANFILMAAVMCLNYFLMDNLVPSGMSARGWSGGPTADALKSCSLELYRFAWVLGILLVPLQLHFVLYYCQRQNFLRRNIRFVYYLAVLAAPTVWTSLWCTAPDAPLGETSSWAMSTPWIPTTGPAGAGLCLLVLVLQVYGLVLLWRTKRLSVPDFAESLGARRIVFAAFVIQAIASTGDGINGALMLTVPALSPVGSGLMGVLLATALIRSRVAADRARYQLESEKAALLECVPQPLLYFGDDFRVQWANDSAAAFAGRTHGELIGTRTNEIWGKASQELLPIEMAWETGESVRREIVRDDSSIWVVYASPVMGTKAKPIGAIVLAMDITEIRRAQEALRNSNIMILRAREEECRRVAQDLHDSVAQGLTALQMHLRANATKMNTETPEGKQFELASQRCQQLGKEVRQISHQLYPPALDLLGFAAALEDILDQYRASGMECYFDCTDRARKTRFSQDVEVALYRTVQEAINNAVRHGQAKKITVQLRQTGDQIVLSVIDNGTGFEVDDKHQGLGMTSMKGRLDGVKGKLDVRSRPGETCLTASVPVENAKPQAPELAAQTATT